MRRHELRIAQSDNVLTAYCVCGEWMGWWKIVTKNRTTGLHDSYYSPKEVSDRFMSHREKAEAHREDAQTAARGIFMGPDGFEVGWCVKHDDLARRWHDGSWGCWWELSVEASGGHSDSDFVPLLDAWNERVRRRGESSDA